MIFGIQMRHRSPDPSRACAGRAGRPSRPRISPLESPLQSARGVLASVLPTADSQTATRVMEMCHVRPLSRVNKAVSEPRRRQPRRSYDLHMLALARPVNGPDRVNLLLAMRRDPPITTPSVLPASKGSILPTGRFEVLAACSDAVTLEPDLRRRYPAPSSDRAPLCPRIEPKYVSPAPRTSRPEARAAADREFRLSRPRAIGISTRRQTYLQSTDTNDLSRQSDPAPGSRGHSPSRLAEENDRSSVLDRRFQPPFRAASCNLAFFREDLR